MKPNEERQKEREKEREREICQKENKLDKEMKSN